MNNNPHKRIIISGGGTGGHVFPAIAIADVLKQGPDRPEILFVGASGRMEMERVPAAGYKIIGLPVEGFKRKLSLGNLRVIFKLLRSLRMAGKIIRDFNPGLVIGVGGYASGPVLRKAARRGLPTLIQEQNSYAGVTNRLLARRARTICVAYEGMEKYFPAEKLVLTGNPVRGEIRRLADTGTSPVAAKPKDALKYFDIDHENKVLLILGGSLGALTINQAVLGGLDEIRQAGCSVLWQCGKMYLDFVRRGLDKTDASKIRLYGFIDRMDLAYQLADVIIARAGALTISELCIAGKPAILVPSPNVAEDHQTRNATALVKRDAAIMIADHEAINRLITKAMSLLWDLDQSQRLADNIKEMALPDSAERIAAEAMKLMS